MGFNTVAILYNDHMGDLPDDPRLGERMRKAMLYWQARRLHPLDLSFGPGCVISQDHADNAQVVIVHRNAGVRADEAKDLDWYAIQQMKECLERNGYIDNKRRKPKSE